MTATGYELVAEDFIAINEERKFDLLLSFKLIDRSKELPTAATSDQLFTDVLSAWVQKEWTALQSFRHRNRNAPGMLGREVPSIVEALKPLCIRAFPALNVVLSVDREILFHPRNYITTAGRLFYEEAPSITFTRFLNDMERYRDVRSEIYESNVSRIAEVHALNRVANIMPREFHRGFDGMLQPGQSVEDCKRAERAQVWRNACGGMTMADLLAEAGMA